MVTIGISAERTVVRGVVLGEEPAAGSQGTTTHAMRRVGTGGIGAAIVEVLDGLTEELGDTPIEDVAVVYRSVPERRSIVTELASGPWAESTLVSDRTALLTVAGQLPEFDEFDTVLVLETVENHTSFVAVGPGRDTELTSGSWPSGIVDIDTARQAIGRIRPILDAEGVHPNAVALCGSAAGYAEIATVLEFGLAVPVTLASDHADVVARAAASVAARQLSALAVTQPDDHRRTRRLMLAAAAVATVLGASGIAVAQIRDDSAAEVVDPTTESVRPSPAAPVVAPPETLPPTGAPMPMPIVPAQNVPEQISAPGAAQPYLTTTTTTHRREEPTPFEEPGQPGPFEEGPGGIPLAAQPTTTPVGAPDGNGLFPGESPPPPANADPAVIQAWWDNHWILKQRWLSGG
ncbi:hypothetical protein [Nocardia sp. NPDC050710]|uniref:hypothetical protein n=1 Tax=Nocardia sp. NPDC050710 TaxID=3157220 RepID=UPI0033DC86D6